jgi:hypothetical protein
MSTIDKQRIAAVKKLEQLGYTFTGDDWIHSANDAAAIAPTITDELHAMLVKRADDLEGCHAGSDEEGELERFRLDVNRNSNRGFRRTCKSDSGCSDCNGSGVARWPGDIRTTLGHA